MQLPHYIIDLVGTLLDEGQDDNTICFAAIQAWMENEKLHTSPSGILQLR